MTLLGVNKVVKTRREMIKYWSGVIGRIKKAQLISSRKKRFNVAKRKITQD